MTNAKETFLATARPLAETLIAHALKAGEKYGITDVKVAISANEGVENEIENGDVTQVSSGRTCNVGIALYAGDRMLSFSKNTLDAAQLMAAMDKNMQAIHLVPENPLRRLLAKDQVFKGTPADLDIYDQNQPSQEEMIDYAKKIETEARKQPGIKGIRSVSASKNSAHALIMATNGLDIESSATTHSATAQIVAEKDGEMQISWDYSYARHFSDMAAPEDIGISAAQKALEKLGATTPVTAEMTIVLDPDAAATFFASVISAVDGSNIYRNTSFLKDKIGQQVLNKGITIVDDPTIPRAAGSAQVDSSGLEMKKVTFVEDGVLKNYLLTLMESRQLNMAPTGRESGLTNCSVLPGQQTPEELTADIPSGIYIKGFKGGSANLTDGTFSRPAYGTLIVDGKITNTPVDGFVVSGNLKDMFMRVTVANDTPKHPNTRTTFCAPTTRINKVTIAGKKPS